MGDLINTMPLAFAEAEKEAHVSFVGLFLYIVLTVAAILVTAAIARKGITKRTFTNKPANYGEQLYLFIENMCLGTIGAHGRKYVPMIITFWLVIFFANVVSLFLASAPTADLSFNLGMALVAIGYVQWEGIKTNGLVGHLSHFSGPRLGIALIPISIMIFVIELISEVMKNVSLSLRLYGNIHGGHEAVTAMNNLGGPYLPFGALLLPIKLLTCVVQAMIFSLLTCVYISLVTHHEEHEDMHDVPGEHGPGEISPMVAG